jgi:hypothetical protein
MDRLALVAPIVASVGHEVIAQEIELDDVGPVTARQPPMSRSWSCRRAPSTPAS